MNIILLLSPQKQITNYYIRQIYIDTFFGKTAALLQGDAEVSNMQRLLITIVLYIVVLSIAMCGILLIYLSVEVSFEKALHFVVVLLVASIPMAIEIVSTTTLALKTSRKPKMRKEE